MSLIDNWKNFTAKRGEIIPKTKEEKVAHQALGKAWEDFNTNKTEEDDRFSKVFSTPEQIRQKEVADKQKEVEERNKERILNQQTGPQIIEKRRPENNNPERERIQKLLREKNFGKIKEKDFNDLKKAKLDVASIISGHTLTEKDGDAYFKEIKEAVKESQGYAYPSKSKPENPEGMVLGSICAKINLNFNSPEKEPARGYSTVGTDFEKSRNIVAFIESGENTVYIKTHTSREGDEELVRANHNYDFIDVGLPFKALDKEVGVLNVTTNEASQKAIEILEEKEK